MKASFLAPVLAVLAAAPPCFAGTVIDDWASVKAPAPPPLAPVALDPASTALLVLDFNGHAGAASGPCNEATKPRCLATLPAVRRLIDAARAKGVLVVYSLSSMGEPGDIRPLVAPAAGDPIVKAGPDKFVGTELRDILAKRAVKTVVVAGTAAEGAVLDTATDAALHGLDVVVPVDGMSSTELYAEQYVAWHFVHAPGVSQKARLTRVDDIAF